MAKMILYIFQFIFGGHTNVFECFSVVELAVCRTCRLGNKQASQAETPISASLNYTLGCLASLWFELGSLLRLAWITWLELVCLA